MKAELKEMTLSRIYRQSNKIDGLILSRIRTGSQTDMDLEELNKRVQPQAPQGAVVLTPYRAIEAEFNNRGLDQCFGESFTFACTRTGTYKKKAPAGINTTLVLKMGCKVVIKANCPKGMYVNGDSGIFKGLDSRDRLIVLLDRTQDYIYVKQKKYEDPKQETKKGFDKETGEETEEIVIKTTGKFTQYPIKLGYASTIHSAQGATMQRVHLHLDRRRPFANGLLYVALSRVTDLRNLTISRPLEHDDNLVKENLWTKDEQGELNV